MGCGICGFRWIGLGLLESRHTASRRRVAFRPRRARRWNCASAARAPQMNDRLQRPPVSHSRHPPSDRGLSCTKGAAVMSGYSPGGRRTAVVSGEEVAMVDITKPQWEQAADAVAELGGQANRYEVWEHLKKFRPDIPFSSVTADLNAVSVNAPSRASYHTGKEPRRTDSGHRYDRLFKVGVGEGSYYVTYDPAIHGVWEIYPDPFATSTNKTAIRQVGKPSFNAAIATQWLEARYPGTRSGTSHITAFRNVAGRELAFDPGPNPSAKPNLMVF